MKAVSVNARSPHEAASSDEVEINLLSIEHSSLSAPLCLSRDPTERISTGPLVYDTRSAWNGADPRAEPYLFVLAAAVLPGDMEASAGTAQIILANIAVEIAEVLRRIGDRARSRGPGVVARRGRAGNPRRNGQRRSRHPLS